MNKIYTFLVILSIIFSGCDKKESSVVVDRPTGSGVDMVPANCNVELVSVNRITADEVTEEAELGDYFFTLKSIKTEKEEISIEGRYAKSGAAVEIVTISSPGAVGIDETIIIKISSDEINTEEDFDCMEYVVKVKVKDSPNCEYTGTDC
ncbi:hypothetical protein [Maribacter sp. 2308TA10-17]|uniref:hypothetical protein n=1 Tax=Maribacter sp. 2308TA10-17 TaxID=3386276 RepID=UPI0039BC7612